MNAYIYKADIYCEDCAREIMQGLPASRVAWPRIMKDDSEYCPQGPYSSGGGEADTPQHCGACHIFLGNPLTEDGYNYLAERITEHAFDGDGNKAVLREWAVFYQDENTFLDNAIQEWQSLRSEDWK